MQNRSLRLACGALLAVVLSVYAGDAFTLNDHDGNGFGNDPKPSRGDDNDRWRGAGNDGRSGAGQDRTDGQCGSAAGVAVTVAPTANLCNAGTASALSGSGSWTWTCVGSGGGSIASCRAKFTGALLGVNISGSEFSWATYPVDAHLDYLKRNGVSLIRLPVAWEKLQPKLAGAIDTTEVNRLKNFLTRAANHGMQVIIDVHDNGRYNASWAAQAASNHGIAGPDFSNSLDDVVGSTAVPFSAFKDFWTKLASMLAGHPGVLGYDIMNEPQNMGGTNVWPTAAQAAVDGIRSVDKSTTIYVEGDGWASALNWESNNSNLHISDPSNNLVYEAHQYFDDDGSSRYALSYDAQGATPTLGIERLKPFLRWLRANNARGFIGEFAVPSTDPRWLTMMDNFLAELKQQGIPATYWSYSYPDPSGAPSWWPSSSDKKINLLPTSKHEDVVQWSVLEKYMAP